MAASWSDSDLDRQAHFLAVKENAFHSYQKLIAPLSRKRIVCSRELERDAGAAGSPKSPGVIKCHFRPS